MKFSVDARGFDEVQRALRQLPADLRDKAAAMALNKTLDKGKTELNRAITDEFAIDRKEVNGALRLTRASSKDASKVVATIDIFGSASKRGRSMNVIRFLEKAISLASARKRLKKGTLYARGRGGKLLPILGFKFKKGGAIKQIEGAFIGNNGRTVFVRTGKGRLPIVPVQMIGVSQMFTTDKIRRRVMARINTELPVEMDRAVKFVADRFGR